MVKLRTHSIFSVGAVIAATGLSPAAIVSAILTNYLIDGFGHRRRGGHSQRTPLTHAVITAPVWGIAAGLLVGLVFQFLSSALTFLILGLNPGYGTIMGMLGPGYLIAPWLGSIGTGILGGLIAAALHLFADSFTCSGVFVPTSRSASSAHRRQLIKDMAAHGRDTVSAALRPKREWQDQEPERPSGNDHWNETPVSYGFKRWRIAGLQNDDTATNVLLILAGIFLALAGWLGLVPPALMLLLLGARAGAWRRKENKQAPARKPERGRGEGGLQPSRLRREPARSKTPSQSVYGRIERGLETEGNGEEESKTTTGPRHCPSCQRSLEPDAEFCDGCGTPQNSPLSHSETAGETPCPGCGADVLAVDRFCHKCGMLLPGGQQR